MQRKIGTEIELGKTVSPFDSTGALSAIYRTVFNYLNAGEKVQKLGKLIDCSYDAGIARYIPRTLELVFQGMLEDRYKRTASTFVVEMMMISWEVTGILTPQNR